jgi:two-component system, NtrC family, response regulator GlrR
MGTLLLEEIDGLGPAARAALNRCLAEGVYRPEGDSHQRSLRARVVATSTGTLSDRFFGIPHHEVEIARLADRPEDVLPLAAHFLASFASERGVRAVGFAPDARSTLLAEAWPGNVTELRERVRQAVQLSDNGSISAEALVVAADSERIPSFREAKRAFEARYVTTLLRRCDGNISQAARLAKKDRKDFYDVIRRTGIDPTRFRASARR